MAEFDEVLRSRTDDFRRCYDQRLRALLSMWVSELPPEICVLHDSASPDHGLPFGIRAMGSPAKPLLLQNEHLAH